MGKKLKPVTISLNCDPKKLLEAVFQHCIKKSKEKGLYKNAEFLTTSMMYELASIICPDSEQFIYDLFKKEYEWKDLRGV